MPRHNKYANLIISSSSIQVNDSKTPGSTASLLVEEDFDTYFISTAGGGQVSLTTNLAIQESGTPFKGVEYNLRYEANIDLNGNIITVFGVTMPAHLSAKKMNIVAAYDGTSFNVRFIPDFAEQYIVEGDSIVLGAVDDSSISSLDGAKLDAFTVTDDKIVSLDGSKLTNATVGDAKITALDGSKILAGTIPATALDSSNGSVKIAVGQISGGDLLTAGRSLGSGVFIEAVAAVAGKFLIPTAVIVIPKNGTPFASNTNLQLICNSTSVTLEPLAEIDLLGNPPPSGSRAYRVDLKAGTPLLGFSQYLAGQSLVWAVEGGDPTGGTFDINYIILYTEAS